MKREKKYYVIGGQYEYHCYGGAPTLLGAVRLAILNQELWDNWQGWRKPKIYRAEDTHIIEAQGWVTVSDGSRVRVPLPEARPVE